eukprot:867642-Rhodomonas_salina.1
MARSKKSKDPLALVSTPEARRKIIQLASQLKEHEARVHHLQKMFEMAKIIASSRHRTLIVTTMRVVLRKALNLPDIEITALVGICRRRLAHRRNRLVSRGWVYSAALRNENLKGVLEFRSLYHPARDPMRTVSMNRAAWIALNRGVKLYKLTTPDKLAWWGQGIVLFWGTQEGYGKVGSEVWRGESLMEAAVFAGGVSSLVDQEEFDEWAAVNASGMTADDAWVQYCTQRLRLTGGTYVLAHFTLLWPPVDCRSIRELRAALPVAAPRN